MNGEIVQELRAQGIGQVWVAFLDYNGLPRGRSLTLAQLERSLRRGINVNPTVVEFNAVELLPPGSRYALASPDVFVRPDLQTVCSVPWLQGTAMMWSDLVTANGDPWEGCARAALQRQIRRAAEIGLRFNVGFEPEGYVFRASPAGVEFAGPAEFATLDGLAFEPRFMEALLATLSAMEIEIEQWTKEYGPGQIEVNLRYDAALRAADTLASFKQAFRAVALLHGLLGTFMPKPFSGQVGSGLHVHLSASGADGGNLFDGVADPELGLSDLARQALAGLLVHAEALTALGASTVNSYKRFLPGSWAPTHVGYSQASRANFIRVPERETARRLEVRVADPACNPHIYLTGLLAAMLDGIERGLEPPRATSGDVGALDEDTIRQLGLRRLPRTLEEALRDLASDATVMSALGPVIGPEYIKVKSSEWEAFRSHVSEWDREWYLRRF